MSQTITPEHTQFETILSGPYDDLKTTLRTMLDALMALSHERDKEMDHLESEMPVIPTQRIKHHNV